MEEDNEIRSLQVGRCFLSVGRMARVIDIMNIFFLSEFILVNSRSNINRLVLRSVRIPDIELTGFLNKIVSEVHSHSADNEQT